jgi:peptide/nickel transport system substrate-binding protein
MSWLKKIFFALTRNERIVFLLAALGAVVSLIVVGGFYLARATMAIPAAGGEYSEGAVGQPEYVNPVIASSKTDLGLVKLVYSSLSDIAASVTASPDMRTWNVRLKENITWQDGQKLTSDDVIFTVQKIQDPTANSPLYASWQGVAATRVSELEVQFNLANPYAFFGDNINNLYILPKHLFSETPPANWRLSDYNLKPIGSGPYKFVSYNKGTDGFISSYNLATWNGYGGTPPLIQNFDFQFFNDENALVQSFNAGQIDGFGNVSPEDKSEIERPYDTFSWRTSGYYAIFWNQSKNLALQDPAVREALSAALDRDALVTAALGGNGVPEYGPIPTEAKYSVSITQTSSQAYAASLLDAAGWKTGSDGMRAKTIQKSAVPLVINLTVPQIDFLAKTAAFVQSAWQTLGVQVNVLPASANDIVGTTIKNRDYEALLFGNVLGPSSDLYSFWDSSQRFSPGLNLAIYSNTKVDNDVESARQNADDASRTQQFTDAEQRIAADNPAVFLYSPDYIYVTNKNVRGIATNLLADPSDRFREIGTWYLNTARVLK